jgi:hypothetical protein
MSSTEMKKHKRLKPSLASRKAFEESTLQEEKAKAAEGIDRLRTSSKTPGWSGAEEIREWRDASKGIDQTRSKTRRGIFDAAKSIRKDRDRM